MTTKQKFEVENPPVIVLRNGRFAYRVKCPWQGKNGKELHAFKFCSTKAHAAWQAQQAAQEASDDEGTQVGEDETPPEEPAEEPEEPAEEPEEPEE